MFSNKKNALALSLIDILLIPFLFFGSIILLLYRRIGSKRLKLCSSILKWIGVFPIRNHYYEPKFIYKENDPIFLPKQIKTFKFNMETQKSFLKSLSYQEEFEVFMKKQDNVTDYDLKFTLNNGSFGSGDTNFYLI